MVSMATDEPLAFIRHERTLRATDAPKGP